MPAKYGYWKNKQQRYEEGTGYIQSASEIQHNSLLNRPSIQINAV